jgi:predicted ATP-dependent protease
VLTSRPSSAVQPGATAATFFQRQVRKDVYLLGELAFSGRLLAVGGLRPKLTHAAELARSRGRAGMAYVVLPMANVRGTEVVDAGGRRVELASNLHRRLHVIPAATALDAVKILFHTSNGESQSQKSGAFFKRRHSLMNHFNYFSHVHHLIVFNFIKVCVRVH